MMFKRYMTELVPRLRGAILFLLLAFNAVCKGTPVPDPDPPQTLAVSDKKMYLMTRVRVQGFEKFEYIPADKSIGLSMTTRRKDDSQDKDDEAILQSKTAYKRML